MRWLLAGCCGLALIHLSVSLQLSQNPRYYGVKTNHNRGLVIYCRSSRQHLNATVKWYKAATHDDKRTAIDANDVSTYYLSHVNLTRDAFLTIKKVDIKSSGVYFCKINSTWGPGTQIKVVKVSNLENAMYRSQLKDGLIVLQGLLLAVCVAAMLLRRQTLADKQDSLYEEPETDHIYEGLAIEACGGCLYEELTVYAQADVPEAPWE